MVTNFTRFKVDYEAKGVVVSVSAFLIGSQDLAQITLISDQNYFTQL